MKLKKIVVIVISPFALLACKGSNIDTPKSPFDDHYVRIGMNSENEVTTPMSQDEYLSIKKYLNEETDDAKHISSYQHQSESRDLKYAYFGSESSTISQCSMISSNETNNRYNKANKPVTITENVTNQQLQIANGGIIKTSSTITDYTFDTEYVTSIKNYEYEKRKQVVNNNEAPVVTRSKEPTGYDNEDAIFGLNPLSLIVSAHFREMTIRETGHYNFKLLSDNNSAVYGKTKDGKYLVKEGYSVFAPFSTTMGRTYKAEDNFFYEGLLESYEVHNETKYRLTYLRFYHELLILSEAYDGTGVPILYLEKPVLIEYSEDKYTITHNQFGTYTDKIPDVTQ